MLDLQDTLIILFLFLFFVYFIWFAKFLVNISFCGWVENPYAKKCDFICLPKTTRTDISFSLTRFICSLFGKSFTTQRLQLRFWSDIFAKFIQQSLLCISNMVVALSHKSSFWTLRACCWLNVLPHTQWLGIRFSLQPYLIDSRFQKLCLFRMHPSSLIRRVVKDTSVLIGRVVKEAPVLIGRVVKDAPVLIGRVVKDAPVLTGELWKTHQLWDLAHFIY